MSAASGAYKLTEIGLLPVDWKVSQLRPLLSRAPRYGIGAAAVRDDGVLPSYIRITDISEDGRYAPDPPVAVDHASSSMYFLCPGDLVVARTGASVGKSYLYDSSDGRLVYAGFLICITPSMHRLDPRYLSYCMQSGRYWDWVRQTSTRSGQPGINSREYASLSIPVPELDEQQRIAQALGDLDSLIASVRRLIVKQRAIRRGMLYQLLTGTSRLSGFSSPWQERCLGDHVRFLNTATNSRAELNSTTGIKYLHYGDIHTSTDVTLDAARTEMPRLEPARVKTADRLRPGDLVFVDASEDEDGVGRAIEITGVPDEGLIAGLHTIACRFDKAVLTDCFKAYLQFCPQFRRALLRLAAGTKVLATSRSHIASVRMSLPDPPEQLAIASALSDVDDGIELLHRRLAKIVDVRRGTMQQLLTGRTRLPVEESA